MNLKFSTETLRQRSVEHIPVLKQPVHCFDIPYDTTAACVPTSTELDQLWLSHEQLCIPKTICKYICKYTKLKWKKQQNHKSYKCW